MSYSDGIPSHDVVSVTVSGTTPVGDIVGPAGKTGRVRGMTAKSTTGVTVADATVTLRDKGGAGNDYASLVIPFGGGVDDINGDFTVDDVSNVPSQVGRIPADSILELVSDGGATAGACDISVFIEWS